MRTKEGILISAALCSFIAMDACRKFEPQSPKADAVMNAPLEGMTRAQYHLFNLGAEEFDEVYTSDNGLGPVYVATSCGSCHAGDNRGHLFTILTRFGQTDSTGNKFLSQGAPQIQNHAIPGHSGESLPAGAAFSRFIAPIASGSGFLELVPDADLLTMADPNDANGDGISGVPNWCAIPSYVTPFSNAVTQNGKYICRFGRKGSTYNLHQQTVQAFNQDIGITSSFLPGNPSNYLEGLNPAPAGDPEISDAGINAVVFYLQALQAPVQRKPNDPEIIQGKNLFIQTGCENCHRQTLKTGYSPVAPLSYKEFHPYTDLLLHDMGSGLDDGYTEGSAKTCEWRTPPLWGLGLAPDAQGGNYFLLHDGRAHSIEEAVLLHGGEAAPCADKYRNLSRGDKEAFLKFLKSL